MSSSGNLWEQEYERQDISTSFKGTFSRSIRFLMDFCARHGEDLSGKRILDCGCGNGRNALPLAQMGCDVFAFDISQTALKQLQEKLNDESEEVRQRLRILRASMAESLPFPDHFFDIVVDITTFDILLTEKEIETHRRELLRVLKPDGYFLYYDMDASDPYSVWLEEQGRVREDGALVSPDPTPIPFRTYTFDEVVRIFSDLEPLASDVFRFKDEMFGRIHGRAILCIIFQLTRAPQGS